jgi:hypothetical protein
MCQSCVDIDKRIDKFRALLGRTTDPAEIERINRQSSYGDVFGWLCDDKEGNIVEPH